MKLKHGNYEIDEEVSRVDFARVHAWLKTSYWAKDVSREVVEHSTRHSSLVVGAYLQTIQVGFLRVISDRATFGWIADVFVDEAHRGEGIATAMLRFALMHPQHQGMRKWCLATQDAHEVYESVGFTPLEVPSRFMVYRPDSPNACDTSR